MDRKGPAWYRLDSRSLSNLVIVCAGVLLYLGLTHLPQVKTALKGVLVVFSPFIAGFVIAFLLNTPTDFFERLYHKVKYRRAAAIATVYFIAILVIIVLLNLILPQVTASVFSLVGNLSVYLDNLNAMVQRLIEVLDIEGEGVAGLVADYQTILRNAANFVTSSMPGLLNFGVAIGNGVISGLTALISSVYMLAGKRRLIRQAKKMLYAFFPTKGVNKVLTIFRRADVIFEGFINGKLLDSAIIGVLCFALTSLFKIPYAVLVSVVIGVTNIIPFFGPIIGAVPCIMILVIVDPWSALRFGILIIVLQQVDGNLLGPKILGDSIGLSPVWVLVAIVVGGGFFGFPGMVLGVPTFAVVYSFLRDAANERLEHKGIDEEGNPIHPSEASKDELSDIMR